MFTNSCKHKSAYNKDCRRKIFAKKVQKLFKNYIKNK